MIDNGNVGTNDSTIKHDDSSQIIYSVSIINTINMNYMVYLCLCGMYALVLLSAGVYQYVE